MRYLPLVFMLGCVDLSYVNEDESSKCDRGFEYVWTELDGGTCGSFGYVIDAMRRCAKTLASECIGENDVECKNGDRWAWTDVPDGGLQRVSGPDCESSYELTPR